MARKKPVEEHVNHDAWAIPFADLLTLLLAFFVVMYAVSTVNESKYRVLSDALSDAFSGPPRSLKPVQAGPPIRRASNVDSKIDIRPQFALRALPPRSAHDQDALNRLKQQAQLNRQLATDLSEQMPGLLEQGKISVRALADRVEIDVGSDSLFASGSASVKADGEYLLLRIAKVLKLLPYRVRVEGHADDVPISTLQFPSNWELSAARAAWVVRNLSEHGIEPQRLSMQGFGAYQPVASNISESGRRTNRRVSIVLDTGVPVLAAEITPQRGNAFEISSARGPKPAKTTP
jgi:chemotaxis protein MotB